MIAKTYINNVEPTRRVTCVVSRFVEGLTASLVAGFVLALAAGPSLADVASPLARTYAEGQRLTYRMTGDNEGWHYSAKATSLSGSQSGVFSEEISWSDFVSNGQAEVAPAPTFRQRLSLDPMAVPSPPDLTGVAPQWVGPVTDLMTFYVDLWLAGKFNALHKPGDHFYFPNPMTPSWADGHHVIIGEDAIDFDMTLQSVDQDKGLAVLRVRHVPPPQPKVKVPAEWMRESVGEGANNWVEVRKLDDGTYKAAVGQERFDVEITLDLKDGKIVTARMDNPVKTIERVCQDAALSTCRKPQPRAIQRTVALDLIP